MYSDRRGYYTAKASEELAVVALIVSRLCVTVYLKEHRLSQSNIECGQQILKLLSSQMQVKIATGLLVKQNLIHDQIFVVFLLKCTYLLDNILAE